MRQGQHYEWAVIRFLIVLEIVLVALLAVRWFDPDAASRASESIASHPEATAPSSAIESPPGSSHIAAHDRNRLTQDLLGATAALTAASLTTATDHAAPAAEVEPKPMAAAGQALDRDQVVEAQRLLARLGYSPGAADGIWGARTQQAVDTWRRRSGRPEGLIDAELLAQLRSDFRARAATTASRRTLHAGKQGRTTPPPGQDDSTAEPAWVASLAGGFQRLIGREFDSRRNPQGIRDYCAVNRETWIFDEGRRSFLWCGRYPTRS